MGFVICLVVGTLAGGLTAWVCRSAICRSADIHVATSIAVGILGALLGLASGFWIPVGELVPMPFSEILASSTGAVVALFFWLLAQRLFLANPTLNDSTESAIREH